MKHEMKESLPKSWDKTKRVYEISYPSGKKEIWKNITARECLTKYENISFICISSTSRVLLTL